MSEDKDKCEYRVEVSVKDEDPDASDPHPKFSEVSEQGYEQAKQQNPEMVEWVQGDEKCRYKFLMSPESIKWFDGPEGGYITVSTLRGR